MVPGWAPLQRVAPDSTCLPPEDNLSHRPLVNYRSGEQLFTQDVRPEQLLEGKVCPHWEAGCGPQGCGGVGWAPAQARHLGEAGADGRLRPRLLPSRRRC